eukprot:GEMP01075339.1.p1 GENE.GEMP01075339.1~~GEMP01075339.1.p1  ORF type:complete len:103 (+),score=29.53 GEMP01075339.1:187-495(+)
MLDLATVLAAMGLQTVIDENERNGVSIIQPEEDTVQSEGFLADCADCLALPLDSVDTMMAHMYDELTDIPEMIPDLDALELDLSLPQCAPLVPSAFQPVSTK